MRYGAYDHDGAHHFTSDQLSDDAFTKSRRADLHRLTAREHLEMVAKIFRGGVASISSQKIFRANK